MPRNQINEPVDTTEQGAALRNEAQLLEQAETPEIRDHLEQAIVVDSVDIVDPEPEFTLPEELPRATRSTRHFVVLHNGVDTWARGERVERAAFGDRLERLLELGAIAPAED